MARFWVGGREEYKALVGGPLSRLDLGSEDFLVKQCCCFDSFTKYFINPSSLGVGGSTNEDWAILFPFLYDPGSLQNLVDDGFAALLELG